jgi:hypothetical protein
MSLISAGSISLDSTFKSPVHKVFIDFVYCTYNHFYEEGLELCTV